MLKKSMLSLSLVVLSGVALVGCWKKEAPVQTEENDKMAEAVATETPAEVVAAVEGTEQVVVADAANPCTDCSASCEEKQA